MAIKDALLTFSDEQAETTVAAHDSTNNVDLAGVAKDMGPGEELYLVIVVTEAVTSGGAATVQFAVQDSADDSSYAALAPVPLDTGAVGKATLTLGYEVMRIALPNSLQRYLKIVYTIGTAVLTAGKFSAWIEKK